VDRASRPWRVLERPASSAVFEEVLLRHIDSLYALAVRLTGNEADAADLLQDATLRALERFHQLRAPGAARAWFARIVVSTCVSRYRQRRLLFEPETAGEPVSSETPESALLARARVEEVEAALASLPVPFRLIVLLADVEEMPLREIASELGCPIGTVASRLARGRSLLRRRLAHLRREVGP
jgi:RNA polymerase sigma-70 factor (ECF subfamily)